MARHSRIRRTGVVLLWLLSVGLAIIAVNVLGIQLFGDVTGWSTWLIVHRWQLLAWRLCLYTATVCGWLWMRQRVICRESSPQARTRLFRVETTAVVATLALESVMLCQSD